jgi:hypothetical protein
MDDWGHLAYKHKTCHSCCVSEANSVRVFTAWLLGWWMCKTVPYVQGVSVAASVYSLIAVSLDR